MNFDEAPEFLKDVKKYSKKWRSMQTDIEDAKLIISSLYQEQDGVSIAEFRKSFFQNKRATVLTHDDINEVVKMRFDCASLGTNNFLRLIFIYNKLTRSTILVELFAKSDKDREDEKRIEKYLV